MDLNRSAFPGLPARRRWRNLPTSGVLRICNFFVAVGVVMDCGSGPGAGRHPAAVVVYVNSQGPHRSATCRTLVLSMSI